MLSKVVTDYGKAARDLIAALRTHRQGVTEKMQAFLAPVVAKGESVPDAGLLLELFARRVERAIHELEAADTAHNEELSDDAAPRRRRDEASEELRAVLLEVKRTLQTLFGDDTPAKFKLPPELSHDPAAILRTGADVADALEKKKLPKPGIEGIKAVDATPWVAKLKKPLKQLDEASKDVAREVREAQVTLVGKNRALSAFEEAFGAGAAAGWGLLAAVGDKELANRISLSPRRQGSVGGKSSDEEVPEGGEGGEMGGSGTPA